MRRACGQAADDATVTEYDPLDGIVVSSMVITASPRQASDTLAAAFPPCATSDSTFVRVRL
jgi:hypothetical protein